MSYINPLKRHQYHLDNMLVGNCNRSVESWLEFWTKDVCEHEHESWNHLREVMIVASQSLQE